MLALTYSLLWYTIKEKGFFKMQTAIKESTSDKQFMLSGRMKDLVLSYVPDDMLLNDLVGFFTAFSDFTRLKILSALSISEMCVTDLSMLLAINQTTVSHQLRLLKNLGAVVSRREGKVIYYALKDELVSDVLLKGVEYLGF